MVAGAPESRTQLASVLEDARALSHLDVMRLIVILQSDLRGHLTPESKDERQLRRRTEAVEAIQRSTELLATNGVVPTVRRFDTVKDGNGGWTHQRVIAAWGTWSAAARAAAGSGSRKTRAQFQQRSRASSAAWTYQDPFSSVCDWVAERPDRCTERAYDAWCRSRNETALPGELLKPLSGQVKIKLDSRWSDIVRDAITAVSPHPRNAEEFASDLGAADDQPS